MNDLREVSKRQAQRKLFEYLAAIDQGTHKPEVMITFERYVLERTEYSSHDSLLHASSLPFPKPQAPSAIFR